MREELEVYAPNTHRMGYTIRCPQMIAIRSHGESACACQFGYTQQRGRHVSGMQAKIGRRKDAARDNRNGPLAT